MVGGGAAIATESPKGATPIRSTILGNTTESERILTPALATSAGSSVSLPNSVITGDSTGAGESGATSFAMLPVLVCGDGGAGVDDDVLGRVSI